MEIILFICGIVSAFYLNVILLKKTRIIENLVFAVVGYFCVYIIVSGILFWMDEFQIVTAQAVILFMELVLLWIGRREIHFKGCKPDIKENVFPIVICMVMTPFIWNKFEIYGMGQDEGVYQTQAIAFMQGDTSAQHEIESYYQVPDEEKTDYLAAIQRKLVGFYLYDDTLPNMDIERREGEASGFYHGIPTFSAILALWGRIAGMENMAGIQSLLYFCAVFLVYFAAGHLELGKKYQNAAVMVFAVSPIVVWVCKSTLTEMMQVCLILAYINLLTEKPEKRFVIGSVIPVIAFSFFHITIYTIIPAIACIYFILYFYEKKKEYLIANIMILLGFIAGIHMMAYIAATYSYTYNFVPLYQMAGFINQENVLAVLTSGGTAGVLFSVILYICRERSVPLPIWKGMGEHKSILIATRIILLLVVFLNMAVIVRSALINGIRDSLRFSTLTGYGMLTGAGLLLCCIWGLVIYTDVIFRDKNGMLISFMFFYFVLIYASVFRRQINHYYYFGRYLVPYIPCIVLTGCFMVSQIRNNWIRKIYFSCSVLIAFTIAVIYDTVLMSENDDTRLPWKVLNECSEIFQNNDVVIIGQDMAPTLFLPLMHMTDANIYMRYNSSLDKQLNDLPEQEADGHIYFLTDEFYGMSQWESVYAGSYMKSEDDNKTAALLPFPTEMRKEKCKIYIYRYYPEQEEYLLGDEELLINGFYDAEGDARWTSGRGTVYCYLDISEYEIRIKQGSVLPLKELGRENVKILLYINGNCADEYLLTAENLKEDIIFHVSSGQVLQGRNEVTIESEKWCPADLGKSDVRQLGISIKSIKFIK